MKNIIFGILVLFISVSCFSQKESKDSLKVKDNKEQNTVKEKSSQSEFQFDSDDIYAGKNNVENIEIEEEVRNTQGEPEENNRHYYRGEIAAETVDLILNVGLIILWLALHH